MVQPVMNVQPYGVNANYANYNPNVNPNVNNQNYNQVNNIQDVQYNSATPAPVQPGSDVRINQDIKYEKPHWKWKLINFVKI